MRPRRYQLGMIALVTALAFALPSNADAQLKEPPQTKLEVDLRGGFAVPTGDLGDVEDIGGTAFATFNYWVHPRVAVRAEGGVQVLNGAELDMVATEGPDMALWHYNGGAQVRLLEPTQSRWNVLVNAGLGATTLDTDVFGTPPNATDLKETFFTTNGGVRVTYQVSPRWNLFVDGQSYVIFSDEEDTSALAMIGSPEIQGIGTSASFPITAGARFQF